MLSDISEKLTRQKSEMIKQTKSFDAWKQDVDGFSVKTNLKQSTITDAGVGRFIGESVARGDILRKCPVYFDSWQESANCIIALKTVQDIELNLNFEDVLNRPKNEQQVNNFACTPFNVVAGTDNDYVYWFQHPCYFNHAGGTKAGVYLEIEEEEGNFFFFIRALRDLTEGEEIFIDYRNFKLPQWFKDYVSKKNMVSTEDLGILNSGVQVDDPYTIQTYIEQHDDYKDFINNFYKTHEEKGNDFAINSFMECLPAGGSVLDIGCCTGWHAYMLYEAGFVVTAMDSSEKYVSELDSNKVNAIVGGVADINFEKLFDGIVLSWMLHHLHRDGIDIALKKIYRALKKDGWLYLSTVEESQDYRDTVGRLYITFTELELKDLLSSHGFAVKYTERHTLNHYEDTPMVGIVIHAQRMSSVE